MSINSLNGLFEHELRDLYSAERQIIDALPKMIEHASSNDLRSAFEQHLDVTRAHKTRLEEISSELDIAVDGAHCKGIEGLLQEGDSLFGEVEDDDTLDAALITAAQRVEHYEMAAYGTARTYAEMLGHSDAARRLQETLDEEAQANKILTRLASRKVNERAVAAE